MTSRAVLELKERHRELARPHRKGAEYRFSPEALGGLLLRTHRSISWLEYASEFADDPDMTFLLHWVAFNAAYAQVHDDTHTEHELRDRFFGKLTRLDPGRRLHYVIADTRRGHFDALLENRHLFEPYWHQVHGEREFDNWPEQLKSKNQSAKEARDRMDSARALSELFGRLYTLRNQLVHGLSSWSSGSNRKAVDPAADLLEHLMPILVGIMLDHPEADWGRLPYPPNS